MSKTTKKSEEKIFSDSTDEALNIVRHMLRYIDEHGKEAVMDHNKFYIYIDDPERGELIITLEAGALERKNEDKDTVVAVEDDSQKKHQV